MRLLLVVCGVLLRDACSQRNDHKCAFTDANTGAEFDLSSLSRHNGQPSLTQNLSG